MRIVIPGEPIAKKRHRCACRNGKPVAYDSQAKEVQIKKFKLQEILGGFDEDFLNSLSSSRLSVSLGLYIPVADSSTEAVKKQKYWHLLMPNRIDIDNYCKGVLDLGNGILWHDDAQIADLHAIMRYSETPCTIIEISAINTAMTDNTKRLIKLFSPDELEAFNVHLCLLKDSLDKLERVDESDKSDYLEAASSEMISFADDYAAKLKKLVTK